MTEQPSPIPVLVPVAVDKPYSYLQPQGDRLPAGTFVEVPFGSRKTIGVVWHTPVGGERPPNPEKLRRVIRGLPVPPLHPDMRRFVEWVACYTLIPLGMVLRMGVSPGLGAKEKGVLPKGVKASGKTPQRLTPARTRVLEQFESKSVWRRAALAQTAKVSKSVVDGLVRQGVLEPARLPDPAVPDAPQPNFHKVSLTPLQQKTAADLCVRARGKKFSATLLDGVTGSGKTEVYFEAIASCIKEGGQVLVLLPEIALTETFLARFAARFGAPPAPWHSGVSKAQRARTWYHVAAGKVRVVAGARSALFLPFSNLRLIIVDEEHDPAYKQEDRAIYHARDMAVVRAKLGGFPIVLASATPSVETFNNVRLGRYGHLVLEERYGVAAMPELEAIDMRSEGAQPGEWLAPALQQAITETTARGQQVLLFLNRRGFAPLTLCRACGHRIECAHCSTWMVEHRFDARLLCHYCGAQQRRPQRCPQCEEEETLVACGPGVERIAEEVAIRFPDLRRMTLSSDTVGGLARLRQAFDAITRADVDIVIGTQLIAKGHHFPHLTLVGVIDADVGLQTSDPRAGERTFQLLQQVSGRAGRVGGKGRALIQTYAPDHPVMQALLAMDREAFYAQELAMRKQGGLPPFGRFAALIVSGLDKPRVVQHAVNLVKAAPRHEKVRVFGPAEPPLALLRGRYRMRILAQSPKQVDLSGYVRRWRDGVPVPSSSIRVQVDVDPISFL